MDAPRNEISIDGDSAEISLFHFDVLRNKFKDGRQSRVLPGLRYCLDTLPADQSASVRFTYESVLRCFPCRQSYVLHHRGTEPYFTANILILCCRCVALVRGDATRVTM
jgi:hypothetical protein